jgi:hypothetical protein
MDIKKVRDIYIYIYLNNNIWDWLARHWLQELTWRRLSHASFNYTDDYTTNRVQGHGPLSCVTSEETLLEYGKRAHSRAGYVNTTTVILGR